MSACRQATHRGRLWSNRHYPPSPKPAKALQIGVRVSRTCGQAIGTDCTGGCQRAARQHTEVGYGVIDITRPRPSRQKHCRGDDIARQAPSLSTACGCLTSSIPMSPRVSTIQFRAGISDLALGRWYTEPAGLERSILYRWYENDTGVEGGGGKSLDCATGPGDSTTGDVSD